MGGGKKCVKDQFSLNLINTTGPKKGVTDRVQRKIFDKNANSTLTRNNNVDKLIPAATIPAMAKKFMDKQGSLNKNVSQSSLNKTTTQRGVDKSFSNVKKHIKTNNSTTSISPTNYYERTSGQLGKNKNRPQGDYDAEMSGSKKATLQNKSINSNFYFTGQPDHNQLIPPIILPQKRSLKRILSKKKIQTKLEGGWTNTITPDLGSFTKQME